MSKERLEEIENKLLQATNEDDEDVVYASICAEAVLEDLQWTVGYAKEQAERVQKLEEAIADYAYEIGKRKRALNKKNEQNKRYREAREIIEQVYKENYVRNAYGYEDGYLDGLDTAMSIIDKALEESL